MWTLEVHNQCMQQAIEDQQTLARARKHGNSIPRHNCEGSTVSVIVALASAGLLIANHARTGPGSLLSRLWKRVWDDGQKKEEASSDKRKKALAAAEARQKAAGSSFQFAQANRSGASASTSRVTATTVDQSFANEAAATVAKTGGKANKKKGSKKKGKR